MEAGLPDGDVSFRVPDGPRRPAGSAGFRPDLGASDFPHPGALRVDEVAAKLERRVSVGADQVPCGEGIDDGGVQPHEVNRRRSGERPPVPEHSHERPAQDEVMSRE